MRTLTTILIVILTIILGRYILTLEEGILADLLIRLFSYSFLGVFSYRVYKILENASKDN